MPAEPDPKLEELTAIIRSIQERVRSRHPSGQISSLGVTLPDLMPVVHARDAAEAKVAAIGTVNPRRGGVANSVIQFSKRQIARGLGWFVRDQVQFNRALMGCVESLLGALSESNRTIAELSARVDERFQAANNEGVALRAEASELKDVRAHWIAWREEWERKQFATEVNLLRSMSDLNASVQHKNMLIETAFRDAMKALHSDFASSSNLANAEFAASMEKSMGEMQKRFWSDLEQMRVELERLIHIELRLVRQRGAANAELIPPAMPAPRPTLAFDYARFAQRFRGDEQYVREKQQFYIPHFAGLKEVLDIGCGRGEFLSVLKENGIDAHGIDSDRESVELCRSKGLNAEVADLFTHLDALPDSALDGIYSSQVIEHLPPERLPELVRLCAAKLRRGGVLALETPNPECLAILATHFYLDPTHTRPVPSPLMVFYLEESGFGNVQVHRLSPAVDTMPSLASIPAEFRDAFFGALDYAVIGRKLS